MEYRFKVYPVNNCPGNKTAFETAAEKINCTGRYLCAPNKELTNMIEFCTDRPRSLFLQGIFYITRLPQHRPLIGTQLIAWTFRRVLIHHNYIYVLKYLHTASQGDFAPFFVKAGVIILNINNSLLRLRIVIYLRKKTHMYKQHVRTCIGGQMTSRKLKHKFLATYYAHWPPV